MIQSNPLEKQWITNANLGLPSLSGTNLPISTKWPTIEAKSTTCTLEKNSSDAPCAGVLSQNVGTSGALETGASPGKLHTAEGTGKPCLNRACPCTQNVWNTWITAILIELFLEKMWNYLRQFSNQNFHKLSNWKQKHSSFKPRIAKQRKQFAILRFASNVTPEMAQNHGCRRNRHDGAVGGSHFVCGLILKCETWIVAIHRCKFKSKIMCKCWTQWHDRFTRFPCLRSQPWEFTTTKAKWMCFEFVGIHLMSSVLSSSRKPHCWHLIAEQNLATINVSRFRGVFYNMPGQMRLAHV